MIARKKRRFRDSLLVLLVATSLPAVAQAQDAAERTSDKDRAPLGVGVQAGLRANVLPQRGLDPFARQNTLVQGSLGAGAVILRRNRFTLLAGPQWELGQTDATARGNATSLTLHRLTASLSAHYALWPWVHPYIRLAPGALHVRANVEDAALDAPFAVRTWTWTVDVAAGVAIPLGQPSSFKSFPYRFGLIAEGGYGFSGLVTMKLTPRNEDAATRPFEALSLPDFRPSGAMFRIAAVASF